MTLTPAVVEADQAKAEQLLPAMQSLAVFCRDILGYRDMNAEHGALCVFLQDDPSLFKLVLMPRYTFKSCIGTIGYTLWRLARQDSLRILIYSHSNAKAEGFLLEIKNHILGLKQSSNFRKTFGPWESDPKRGLWNQSAITVAIRTEAQAEPSVDTAGVETGKVGAHYDLILFDDLVAKENVTTPEQIEKVKEVYRSALSLLKPGGEVLLLGTRWHYGDLYGQLLAVNAQTQTFSTFIRQAEVDGTYPFADIGENALTPVFLRQQRIAQGNYVFSCLYQNNPTDPETALFKPSQFRFYPSAQIPDGLFITGAIDPAISEAAGADDSAITVCGTDADGVIYVLDAVASHLLPDQLMAELFRLHEKWHLRRVGIETQTFQKMLLRDLERWTQDYRKAHPTGLLFSVETFAGSSAVSKDLRIRALQPWHERGALLLPGTNLELLTGVWQKLAMQMVQYPHSPHDDLVDSLAYHIPLHRAGERYAPPKEIPYTSAAWWERECQKEELRVMARRPRWHRKPVPELSLS